MSILTAITYSRELLALCLVASLIYISGCSTSPSPEKIVQEYKQALNSHDVESLMKYYTDDVSFEIAGLPVSLSGREALRGVAEYDSVLNTIMSLSDMTIRGDSVFCKITETNDWLKAAGIPQAHYSEATFALEGGRISSIQAELSDTSAAKINGVLDSLILWASQNYPEELAETMPEGVFIYNADNAMKSLTILREWRQTMESEKAGK